MKDVNGPYTDILFEQDGRIATIAINRPHRRNAFRQKTLEELTSAFVRAGQDASVGVMILTGEGDTFCAGGDIGEMLDLTPKTGAVFVQHLFQLARSILDFPKPVIAKIDGYCIGGGNELQLFCDLSIAGDRARFGQVGPKVGSAPLWGGTLLLPRLIGLRRAKEMMFLCEPITAARALDLGLINRVVPSDRLSAATEETCRTLLQRSPQSLRLLKRSLHRDFAADLKKDLELLEGIYGSQELREGMAAFLEKREPRYPL